VPCHCVYWPGKLCWCWYWRSIGCVGRFRLVLLSRRPIVPRGEKVLDIQIEEADLESRLLEISVRAEPRRGNGIDWLTCLLLVLRRHESLMKRKLSKRWT
jgi:hypothetical protein